MQPLCFNVQSNVKVGVIQPQTASIHSPGQLLVHYTHPATAHTVPIQHVPIPLSTLTPITYLCHHLYDLMLLAAPSPPHRPRPAT